MKQTIAKRIITAVIILVVALFCAACGGTDDKKPQETDTQKGTTVEKKAQDMTLKIDGKKVDVKWAANKSVDSLRKMSSEKPLEIKMSMYDDFEQVGEIGKSLPAEDENITTAPGDIMLYSGSNIVVFYGSNTWDYTRLGKIEGLTESELKELLGSGDVTVSISME